MGSRARDAGCKTTTSETKCDRSKTSNKEESSCRNNNQNAVVVLDALECQQGREAKFLMMANDDLMNDMFAKKKRYMLHVSTPLKPNHEAEPRGNPMMRRAVRLRTSNTGILKTNKFRSRLPP